MSPRWPTRVWCVPASGTLQPGQRSPGARSCPDRECRVDAGRRGGWKGADTAFLRDHLHARRPWGAWLVPPRQPSSGTGSSPIRARPDGSEDGAIAGIPAEVCELHSDPLGTDHSRGRTRLLPTRRGRSQPGPPGTTRRKSASRTCWPDAGGAERRWSSPGRSRAAIEVAGSAYRLPEVDLEVLAGELLGPDGRLASEKTFTRGDVIIAAAPHLHRPCPSLCSTKLSRTSSHMATLSAAG